MPKKKFFDLKSQKSFETDKFTVTEIQTKGGTRTIARTIAPSGAKASVFIKKK